MWRLYVIVWSFSDVYDNDIFWAGGNLRSAYMQFASG